MKRSTRLFSTLLTVAGLWSSTAIAQSLPDVTVAVGGRSFLGYLPLTLAERLGYYKDAGINVVINDFAGGAKAMETLIGGSVDVALGGFEHALLLQTKGVEIRAVTLINTTFGQVIALKPDLAKKYKSPEDLKGMKFGVIGPGSASAIALHVLMAKANLPPSSVAQIGIGGGPGAIAAVKSGQLDGVSNSDPVISQMVRDGDMVPIVDTRTEKGQNYLYGGPVAATSVMMKPDFIEKKRPQAKAFATAIVRALKWMHTATAEQVADTVPASYHGGDRALYIESVKMIKDSYTTDGIYQDNELANTYKFLAEYGSLKGIPNVDVKRAVDNSLVK